ncbi:hypothetical protein ASD21_19625 [Caulobacter sp. Root1455]|nr:hypothetical protein ASD38_20265 [Caulobacter sp. Root487D2Y]KQZ04019.1 hypothetical protein ASD21_19625 [Caulobacter sp. Root1455]
MIVRVGLLVLSFLLAFLACVMAREVRSGADPWIWALAFLLPPLWIATVVGSCRIGRFGALVTKGALPAPSGVCAVLTTTCYSSLGR